MTTNTDRNEPTETGRFAYLRKTENNGFDELELVTGIEPRIGVGVGFFASVEEAKNYAASRGWPTEQIEAP